MLRPKSPQTSFFVSGNYLYDRIVPADHLLRKINAVVDFSFVNELVRDRYTPDFGRPAEDPEFMLRLYLLQYIYGDSDRQVIENARMHNGYKYFLGMAVDEEPPDDSTVSYFRAIRLGEDKFRQVFENIVQQRINIFSGHDTWITAQQVRPIICDIFKIMDDNKSLLLV